MLKRQPSNSASSDDEVDCPLSGAEALAACKEFATVTKTDTGLAMMMLQQNQWNLQQAIDAYQNSQSSKSSTKQTKSNVKRVKNEDATVEQVTSSQTTTEEKVKKHFKILSWNIDGLDEQENTLEARTRGVINVIQREEPDAVFLQEVILASLELIRQHLPNYEIHTGNNDGYFVIILTRRERFKVQSHEIIPYPNSRMNRNLLIVHTVYKDQLEIDLMTAHHESGTEPAASDERIEQLKQSFQRMLNAPKHRLVLFGGDLNLREKELQKAGDVPSGIVDLWIATGRRKECAYTWDMNRNTNLFYPSNTFRPRARFDRLYYRAPQHRVEETMVLQPTYFELEGLEKLQSIKRYCSDHWAIQAYFDLL